MAFMGACQSAPSRRQNNELRARPGDVVAAEPRIYAFSQRPLLLPLAPARPSESLDSAAPPGRWRPARIPTVQYESGQQADAQLLFLEAQPQADSTLPWLPTPARWTVTEWAATQDPAWNPGGGFWAMLIAPPPDGRRQVLRFNGSSLPVIWLPEPPRSTDAARAPPLDLDRSELRALGGTIRAVATDPLQAWRVRILTDRLRAAELWATPPSGPEEPALAALADQLEARWRTAIGALEREDPALAAEFVARLTAVIRLPTGAAAPIWPPDDSALAAVRSALLSPTNTRAAREQAVRGWLGAAPPAVAWMIDDSAESAREAGAVRTASVIVANLTSEPVVSSTAPTGKPALNAVRLQPHMAESLTCSLDAQPDTPVSSVVARAGGWTATLPAVSGTLRVTPPGLLMGPLYPRWDMPSLLSGRPRQADPRTACVAMLQRSPTESARWQVYVECSGAEDGDVVTLWFGPFEAALAEVRVGPGAPQGPAVFREGSRWWAMVSVPDEACGADGLLTIGVTRQSAAGALWSWPRPMAPGQSQPGRAIVDLSQWGSLAEPVRDPAQRGER